MGCEKKDCKYYDTLAAQYCSYHSVKTCRRYKAKGCDAKRLKMLSVLSEFGKKLHISEKHYQQFMKFKNITVISSEAQADGLIITYQSLCGNVKGKIKFNDMGQGE